MKTIFLSTGREDYLYRQETDKKIPRKINSLIREVERSPFQGAGKPEPLKYNLSGWWSRRIDLELRLVYRVENDSIYILQCRYHY